MAEPLKNSFNPDFFNRLEAGLLTVYPEFQYKKFCGELFNTDWNEMELKARMHHLAKTLGAFLPDDPTRSIPLIVRLAGHLKKNNPGLSFAYMFIPDFVKEFGLGHIQISISAMEKITQFTSCEFAVRHFILKDRERMLDQMLQWSGHAHAHVRRLSSEGCRPRLPWAIGIDFLKKDPSPILPILNNLKEDPSEFVRKSVANNINDISKDHPALVISLVKKWKGKSSDTDWILKHGSRSLLKAGNPEILDLFNLKYTNALKVKNLDVLSPIVHIGHELLFRFTLENNSKVQELIRVEYQIYYQRSNGTYSRKIFKITERVFEKKSRTEIVRKHSFRPITTRKYYPGIHKLSLVLNGRAFPEITFQLQP